MPREQGIPIVFLIDAAVLYTGPALPEEAGELAYRRARPTSAGVGEAGTDDGPRRRRKPVS